ncbi:MAG: bifunctional folylpolyglutamate synthase/dihydrofolate synthase [Janthinobacterium lividum]
MNFDEALAYLEGRLRLGVKLGNDRFLALLDRLGNPQERLRVVHIAGTKGKGSTTAMAASVLQAAGCKVGMYLSPYVYDVRERIQINGAMIPRPDFARWVTQIVPHIEALEQTEFGPTTEFELKTAIGLCYFAEQAVDYAVLEVGLGGRLDATNVVSNPLVTVITNIGLDHTELLGSTLTEIAGEKAGIIKPGIPCITGVPEGGEAWEVIARVCAEKNAPLRLAAPPKRSPDGLILTTPRRILSGVHLGLRGAFQELNAAAALTALDSIIGGDGPKITDDAARLGLETAWVPGRLEQVLEYPTVVLDVAHNALSAEVLAEALRAQHGADTRRLTLVVGLSRNHDPEPFLEPLVSLKPARLIATQPAFRPRPAEDIADAARHFGFANVEVIDSSIADAVGAALSEAGPDDLICVTGSFYTVGELPPDIWSRINL